MTSLVRQYTSAWVSLLISLVPALAQHNSTPSTIINRHTSDSQPAQQAFGKQEPVFIENSGQWDSTAKFLLRCRGLDLWITDRGVVYDILRVDESDARSSITDRATARPSGGSRDAMTPSTVRRTAVVMSFLGAAPTATAHGAEHLPGYHNYLIGNDRSKWARNVPLYAGARIEKLYSGIDAVFYLDAGQPRYDLVLAPGADASQVRMEFQGAEKVSIDRSGSLVIATKLGEVLQRELYAYQMRDGAREQVRCAFRKNGDGTVRFDVGSYDHTRALVIDPVVIVYATYLGGGSHPDEGSGIAVDDAGNAYISGYTSSTDFPTLNPAQASNASDLPSTSDGFVTKLTPNGAFAYSTYLGGSSGDGCIAIALDGSGNIVVTGNTYSTDFPTLNALQPVNSSSYGDAFVVILNSAGSIAYSTYLGGDREDRGTAIAVDGSGNVYVAGFTSSNNFPTLNPAQSSNASYPNGEDGFVTKLTPGGALSYSTYLGGTDNDICYDIAVDIYGEACITGYTISLDFPTLFAMQSHLAQTGKSDAFVTKLSLNGAILYSTYLGGSGDDAGSNIAVDWRGNAAYITGFTSSTDFPTRNPAQLSQGTSSSERDAFVTKLNSGGSIAYSTYLGGTSSDLGEGIAVDSIGNVYVTGYTGSNNFPTLNPAQSSNAGYPNEYDAFVTRLNSSGAFTYSTYLGGSGGDFGWDIAIDGEGHAFVTGSTASSDFPTINPAQPAYAGSIDAFVTKLAFTSGVDRKSFKVINTNDFGPGSLREAIIMADTTSGATSSSPHIIDASEVDGKISLQSPLPPLVNHIRLDGPASGELTVTRGVDKDFTIFEVDTATVTIAHLTITNGSLTSTALPGGGILNNKGTMTVDNCTVSGNSGGGIMNYNGTMTVNDCTISNNFSDSPGGGIGNNFGTLTVNNCTISNNAASSGSGIGSPYPGTVTINNSTISGNSGIAHIGPGTSGGGISSFGTLTINNSTISGNSADVVGGIMSLGEMTLTNVTITANTASTNTGGVSNNVAHVRNSIIAGNSAPSFADGFGTFISEGNNLIGDSTSMFGFTNGVNGDQAGTAGAPIDPKLGPLQDNGGPTFTHAPLIGSLAINAGSDKVLDDPYNFRSDQRGFARKVGTHVDIGALEFGGDALSVPGERLEERTTLRLSTVMPNPVDGEMQVDYMLSEAIVVTLEIYAADGRLVATPLTSESRAAGGHSQSIVVSELAPGVYTLRLVSGMASHVQRFVVVR